jgi:hypothetical protein
VAPGLDASTIYDFSGQIATSILAGSGVGKDAQHPGGYAQPRQPQQRRLLDQGGRSRIRRPRVAEGRRAVDTEGPRHHRLHHVRERHRCIQRAGRNGDPGADPAQARQGVVRRALGRGEESVVAFAQVGEERNGIFF